MKKYKNMIIELLEEIKTEKQAEFLFNFLFSYLK